MKYCKNCGAELLDSDIYCTKCGSSLAEKKQAEPEKKNNGFSIAGFILAFFIPLLGWIFGGLGMKKSKELNGVGWGLGLAAIIISSIDFIITLYLRLTGVI